MTPDERALLPPPPRCLKCDALDQVGRPGAMRSTCRIPGAVMHDQCAWFNERRLTSQERKHG